MVIPSWRKDPVPLRRGRRGVRSGGSSTRLDSPASQRYRPPSPRPALPIEPSCGPPVRSSYGSAPRDLGAQHRDGCFACTPCSLPRGPVAGAGARESPERLARALRASGKAPGCSQVALAIGHVLEFFSGQRRARHEPWKRKRHVSVAASRSCNSLRMMRGVSRSGVHGSSLRACGRWAAVVTAS